jgi:release factor glutamine methyltransferase
MNLRDFQKYINQELTEFYDKNEIQGFSAIIVEDILGLRRMDLHVKPEMEIESVKISKIQEIIRDLKLYKPIQYLIGKAWFYDLPFMVNENVLIPRPETEELVDWIIKKFNAENSKFSILDIGTGSGCIPVSIARNCKSAQVFALDISEKALEVAQHNAESNAVNVHFIHSNILDEGKWEEIYAHCGRNLDAIVSNPPYIRESEKKLMHANVLENEPWLALFVSDKDPLLFYRKITQFARKYLKTGGALFFEINEKFGDETCRLLENEGFGEIELRKDLSNKNRMIFAVKK